MVYLNIVMFICSLIGYFYLIKTLFKIDGAFIPLTTFSFITVITYFGGLCQILQIITYILLGLGLLGFIYFLIKKGWHDVEIGSLLFYGCFIVGTILFLGLLLRTHFIHYDNFSHWGIVVKDMLLTHAFPNRSSTVIDFTNYPLGMVCWIYYGCQFLGHSQGMMLFIQGIFIFSCFYAMFGIIQEKKRFLLYVFLGAGCSLLSIFNITIRINNLLVDFILPVMTLAGFSIIYTYRYQLKKATFILVWVLGLLTIVKSTGSLFALFDLLYFVYIAFIDRKTRTKKNILAFVVLLTSYIPTLLWKIHVNHVFSGVSQKFDTAHLQTKTAGQVNKIIHLFVQSSFDFSSRQTIGIFAFEIIAIIACFVVYRVLHKKWSLMKAIVALDVMLVAYFVGILAMYIYSMPLDEALYLAGFERYTSSIVILFCGALVLCATIDLQESFEIKMGMIHDYKAFHSVKTKKYYQVSIIVLSALSIITLLSEYNGMVYNQQQYATSLPCKVEAVTHDCWNHQKIDHHRYLVYASDKDIQVTNYYLQYITRYMLFADHVDGLCAFYEDNLVNLLKDYDYLVIVESDHDEKMLLKEYFNQSGKEKIYKVKDLFKTMTPAAKKQYQQIRELS